VISISLFSIVENDGVADTLRLMFPTTIAPYYGRVPFRLPSSATPAVLELSLAIAASAPIQTIKSTSHAIETVFGRLTEQDTDGFDARQALVRLSSRRFLENAIVIVVRYKDLDRPRCTVETFLQSEGAEEDTDALALTLTPRFDSALIPSQGGFLTQAFWSLPTLLTLPTEYIFLVDRSGSMGDSRMSAVQSALRVFMCCALAIPATNLSTRSSSHLSHLKALHLISFPLEPITSCSGPKVSSIALQMLAKPYVMSTG
jgi:hypothetical protein